MNLDPRAPIFPSQAYGSDGLPCQEHSAGLTIRAYLAAQNMAAILGDIEVSRHVCADPRYNGENFRELVAINSVEFADALLAELNKP